MIDLTIKKPHLFRMDSELLDSDKNKFSNFILVFFSVLKYIDFGDALIEPITYEKVALMKLKIDKYLKEKEFNGIPNKIKLKDAIQLVNATKQREKNE